MEKLVRYLLIIYYTITGFFFYLRYLSHSHYNGRLFYSKALGKVFRLKCGRTFVTNYTAQCMYVQVYTNKEITLTFRDLGLYKLKLTKEK